MSRILDVYLSDNFVGTLAQDESGELEFAYDRNYCKNAIYGISLSMPLNTVSKDLLSGDFHQISYKGKKVKTFFSGLLPEENVRQRLSHYLGVSEKNPFALLEIIGGDCAGALALYPQGQKPTANLNEIETLDDVKLKEILELIRRRPMLVGDEGYRLSLAGAQDKLAVGFMNGNVQLIKGGAPTTHILKPIIEHVQDSAHNELFCMKLAKRMGIDVPEVALRFVDNIPYYLIERYDRQITTNGDIERIHQEDFCQVLGIAPEIKYEREGGPNLSDCLHIISNFTGRPAVDQIKFLDIVIFNYLIGNADAHGKNFSLLYKRVKPELAPAYDLISTAIYPNLSEKMAMKIGGKYMPKDVYPRHFHKIVVDTKAARSMINARIQTQISKIVDEAVTLEKELKAAGIPSDIYQKIIEVIKDRSQRLSQQK